MSLLTPVPDDFGELRERATEISIDEHLRNVRPKLKSLFARYRIPPQDTEDILQQSLLAMVHKWGTIRDPEAWLIGTLRNRCLMYWRERRRKLYEAVDAAVLEWVSEPEAPHQEREDLWKDLDTVIDRLPGRCKSLLLMRYKLGYDNTEIARRLGYSPNSISKITSRCLAGLTRELADAPADCDCD